MNQNSAKFIVSFMEGVFDFDEMMNIREQLYSFLETERNKENATELAEWIEEIDSVLEGKLFFGINELLELFEEPEDARLFLLTLQTIDIASSFK